MSHLNIKLIIGLGNPGPEYKDTYHNAGFLLIDYLAKNQQIFNFSFDKLRTPSHIEGQFSIFKSETYMNESGGFVKKMLKKSGAKPDELLVAHDDSDLYVGEYKLAFDRGAAGHKGVQSIIDALGTKKFWRLRIGIRPDIGHRTSDIGHDGANPPSLKLQRARAGEFVLKKIKKEDKERMTSVIEEAVEEMFKP